MPLRPTSAPKARLATWSEPQPKKPKKATPLLGNSWARMMAASNRVGRMF